jgi:opacity protein-like surface antigen
MKKTKILVAAFIVILIAAGYAATARADTVYIGLGKSIINSSAKVGEIGYERKGWEVQASLMGAGDTKNGQQDQMSIYSVSYITRPGWGYRGVEPYVRLGVSHNTGSTLIGSSNFRLGLGVEFNQVFRLEYVHHSSAGIHRPNTGLDYVALSYVIPTPW